MYTNSLFAPACVALLAVCSEAAPVAASNYTLSHDYSGAAFFQGFTFDAIPDPTNGLVEYVDKATANSSSMAGLFAAGEGAPHTVYLGVGGSATIAGQTGRRSIRVSTNQTWNHALIIADIAHMPSACGAWPAFWMLGSGEWPLGGEIDILEGVNDQNANIMTLHTTSGMALTNDSSSLTGVINTGDCDVDAANQQKNQGCQIQDKSSVPSFGKPFNDNGGGVFSMQWTSDFIKIWFFPRNSIPTNVLSAAPNPSSTGSWGKPNALFKPTQPGAIDLHFKDLQIIFDTTYCGDWAGNAWNASTACSAKAPTCEAYMATNPVELNEAYWAINSIKVFQT